MSCVCACLNGVRVLAEGEGSAMKVALNKSRTFASF